MFKAGIFLPMDEHVARYCRTSNFEYCQQYLNGCAGIKDTVQQFAQAGNDSRRHHERLAKKFSVRLYACDNEGKPLGLISDQAETIDLSIGGLGMLSSEKLEAGQQVAIHFDSAFTIPGLSGKGTIRWCRSANGDHYQAGLAFAGPHLGRVVAGLWGEGLEARSQ